jgi:hypothetical protein
LELSISRICDKAGAAQKQTRAIPRSSEPTT